MCDGLATFRQAIYDLRIDFNGERASAQRSACSKASERMIRTCIFPVNTVPKFLLTGS